MLGSKRANSEDGKLELLTHKNSILVLVDHQPSMFKSIRSGDKTIIKSEASAQRKLRVSWGFLLFCHQLIPNSWEISFRRSPDCFRARRYLHERCQALMLLKTKEHGTQLRNQVKRNWSFQDCGPAYALRIPFYML